MVSQRYVTDLQSNLNEGRVRGWPDVIIDNIQQEMQKNGCL